MQPLMKHLTALCATLALLPLVVFGQAGTPNPPAYVVNSGPLGARVNVINGGARNLANNSTHAAR